MSKRADSKAQPKGERERQPVFLYVIKALGTSDSARRSHLSPSNFLEVFCPAQVRQDLGEGSEPEQVCHLMISPPENGPEQSIRKEAALTGEGSCGLSKLEVEKSSLDLCAGA